MKQSRRQELKTNELSVFLRQIYTTASQNLNYVIGGLAVVVLVLVILLYAQHRKTQAREAAWKNFNTLLGEDVTEKPEVLEKARALAAEHQGGGELGHLTLELAANMAYQLAMEIPRGQEREKKIGLLKDSRERFESLIRQNPGAAVTARARMSLAAIEETLLTEGESTREKVRALYEAMTKDSQGYGEMASHLLNTLDQRTEPLTLVATRPAEPPATAPATRPGVQAETAPATLPAGMGTRPAAPPTTAPAR